MKPKLLIIGDNEKAPYHPLNDVQPVIKNILQPYFEPFFSDNYEEILGCYSELEQFELIISYLDRWENPLSDLQTGNLLRYLSTGKGLLVIHCGISLQARHEFKHIIGAQFLEHPPIAKLQFSLEKQPIFSMEITDVSFELEDEPYIFEFDNFSAKNVFLYYRNSDNQVFPAGWITSFGPAKVIYLMPGHSRKSFENKSYQNILLQSIELMVRKHEMY
jgi:hypothetical protein